MAATVRPASAQIERGAVGAVVVGEQHGAPAGQHAVAVDIGGGRRGEHDAGPVVVGEDQRPLDRAGRQHDLPGADLPQPLARRLRAARRQMIADPLDQVRKLWS